MISSPKPPDPYEQASAQAGANIDSAVANDLLNNRTEITPTGRIDYIDQGTQIITDSQGKQREIPIRDRVITLSDGQQAILDGTEAASRGLLDVANERLDYMQDFLPQGLDTSGLTEWANQPQAPELDTGRIAFDQVGLYEGGGQLAGSYGYNPELHQLSGVDQPADLRSDISLNTDFSGIGSNIRTGGFGNVSGDIAGVGEGIQRSVDLNTAGGAIGGLNRSFNGERISGDIADAGAIQRDVNYQGPELRYGTTMERFEGDIADAGDVTRSLGRGFTKSRSAQVEAPGSYLGVIEKIPYLKSLGVTAVELMPVNEFPIQRHLGKEDGLVPTIGATIRWPSFHLIVDTPTTRRTRCAGDVNSKQMVKALHARWHRSDSGCGLQSHLRRQRDRDRRYPSRALENQVYYILSEGKALLQLQWLWQYTINGNHPVVREMIFHCLRHWVHNYHIDGFRFDLASILSRDRERAI